MNSAFDPVTIVFVMLAIFIVYRLRSVLGQRTGNEPPPGTRRDGKPEVGAGNVVPLPGAAAPPMREMEPVVDQAERWKKFAEPGTPVAAGLQTIAAADPSFDPQVFLNGAKAAYEMIVVAFARGDRRALRDLLSKEVFEGFVAAIGERESRGESVESTFVSIDKAEIAEASVKARQGMVTVHFVSKIITATRNKAGDIVEGAPDKVVDVTDIWTFSRDVTSRDPNWRLVATEAGQ